MRNYIRSLLIATLVLSVGFIPHTASVSAFASKAHEVATTDSATPPRIVIPITAADPKAAGQTLVVGSFVPDLVVTRTSNIHYTWGWVTGTAYLNKYETRQMRTYSYALIVAAGLCAAYAWETGGAACVVSGAMTAQWNYVASNAVAAGACIKIKVPIMWGYQYTGGYCT